MYMPLFGTLDMNYLQKSEDSEAQKCKKSYQFHTRSMKLVSRILVPSKFKVPIHFH